MNAVLVVQSESSSTIRRGGDGRCVVQKEISPFARLLKPTETFRLRYSEEPRRRRPSKVLRRGFEHLDDFRFDRKERRFVAQHGAVDEEHVFDALAERRDLRRLQVDVVPCKDVGDVVDESEAVRGGPCR